MNSGSNAAPTGRILKFGNCHLDKLERKIYRDGKPVELSPKSFDVLQLLAECSGEILKKEEILDCVWADSFVEEGNLAVHVSRLRKVLRASKSEPFIETVSGVGYRFVLKVHTIDEDVWELQMAKVPESSARATGPASSFDSIAVLPLLNENGDEEVDYLADGLTESIINDLSTFHGLRVLARNTVFRFKGEGIDVREVGRKLDVSAILTGRLRLVRNNLVISVELSDTSNGALLWGTIFNETFEDILDIQERITGTILDRLASHLGPAAKPSRSARMTENTESYRSYLKGRYLLNKRSIKDINKAIKYFQHSISLDPTNAHSYIQLAESTRLLQSYDQISYQQAFDEISGYLIRASEIDLSVPELFVSRAMFHLYFEFNFKESERNLKQALSLNPNSGSAHHRYARLCVYECRSSEALVQMSKAALLDPFSLISNKHVARNFYFMAQFENSIIKLEECLELEPEDFQTHLLFGINLTELARYDEAERALRKSLDLQHHIETLAMIGYMHSHAGDTKKARIILSQLEEMSKSVRMSSSYFGILCGSLGDVDRAFLYLDKASQEHEPDLVALMCDPRWKSLRDDSRYDHILEKIGFPTDQKVGLSLD